MHISIKSKAPKINFLVTGVNIGLGVALVQSGGGGGEIMHKTRLNLSYNALPSKFARSETIVITLLGYG